MITLKESILKDMDSQMAATDHMTKCKLPTNKNFMKQPVGGIYKDQTLYRLDWRCSEIIKDYTKDLEVHVAKIQLGPDAKFFDKNEIAGLSFVVGKGEIRVRFFDNHNRHYAPIGIGDKFNGGLIEAKKMVLKICQAILIDPSLVKKIVDCNNDVKHSSLLSVTDVLGIK